MSSDTGMKRIKRINAQHNALTTVPAGLLKNTALQELKLEGCPLVDKGKIDGWDKYITMSCKCHSRLQVTEFFFPTVGTVSATTSSGARLLTNVQRLATTLWC